MKTLICRFCAVFFVVVKIRDRISKSERIQLKSIVSSKNHAQGVRIKYGLILLYMRIEQQGFIFQTRKKLSNLFIIEMSFRLTTIR